MIAAVAGSTYVAHTASPFVMVGQEDADAVLKPAIDGTLAVMEGCKAAGVKRIVITSSMASVMGVDPKDKPADLTWTAEMWSNPDRPGGLPPYVVSKYEAERAAWKYVEDLPEGERFELATVNPCLILGPANQTEAFRSG